MFQLSNSLRFKTSSFFRASLNLFLIEKNFSKYKFKSLTVIFRLTSFADNLQLRLAAEIRLLHLG